MNRPRPGQLGHTCIRVKDVKSAIDFYNGLLGMPVVETREDRMAALGSAENYLEVFKLRDDQTIADVDPQQLRLNHFCLWVEDMEGLQERAAAAGHPFTQPIGASKNWVKASIKVGWVVDPDGNRVELLEWVGTAEG